jgi:hypothetical protein
MLLRHGISLEPGHLERGREVAQRSIEQLDGLRQRLQARLEEELARAELRFGSEEGEGSAQFARLRLAAQKLADQLAEVEELEAKLELQLAPKDQRHSGEDEQRISTPQDLEMN